MPKQLLALSPNQPPRLELKWGGYMREFTIRLDDQLIGRIDGGQRELSEGREFTLPDGSSLSVRLKQSGVLEELEVLHNGYPLPLSASHPSQKIGSAVRASFFWGIALILAGLFYLFKQDDFLLKIGFSGWSVLFGGILIVCATQIARYRPLALLGAMGAFGAEAIIGIVLGRQAQLPLDTWFIWGIVIRGFVFPSLWTGWKGMLQLIDLKKLETEEIVDQK